MHRFTSVMGNLSLRADLYRAIDLVMSSSELLPRTFCGVPDSADLLGGQGPGSAAARHVLNVTLSLYANASGRFPLEAAGVRNALMALAQGVAELPVNSCHSYLRRLVLATLVRVQLRIQVPGMPPRDAELAAQLRFSPDTDVLIFRIYRILYAKYRQGAAAKGAIEFLHISKSGGTSMCTVADANGCSAESTTNFGNCMVRRFDDRPRWVSATTHNETAPLDGWRWYYRYLVRRGERTCEYRDEFMHRKHFTFYSNEFAVHGGLDDRSYWANGTSTASRGANSSAAVAGSAEPATAGAAAGAAAGAPTYASAHVCPQFLNVILLRHPLSRLVSHIKWIMKVYRTEYGKRHEEFFRGRDAAWWRRFAPAAVDNYNLRLLLGEGVYYAPIGSLSAAHLAAARLVLLGYDVVLMLEAPDVDELWLKQALGWRVGLRSASARVAGTHRSAAEMMPPDLDVLVKANEHDVLLYNFASAVHQIDGVMFAAMAAAGVRPYHAYDSLDPKDQWVGRRVKCGFVTRRQQFLVAMEEDPKTYERSYNGSYPRVLSPDERVRGAAAEVAAALAAAGANVQPDGSVAAAGGGDDDEDGREGGRGRRRQRRRSAGRRSLTEGASDTSVDGGVGEVEAEGERAHERAGGSAVAAGGELGSGRGGTRGGGDAG
ncbi:hypothetical protein HYH02_011686 [Chlamydomonas schloesseri]|uniref:Sulfotransferase n=1 Tax=Chlamydomonas schloesseri TaxID=2026947 RepID=A0A835W3J6_9CHLO|nr:hypothetical protein HYH02_011686 [Chlamydomonas schloesseri]|eukprot:KAG2435973.1 hypothetical protein HYH02_011686 [Chlamydomonas schloesseri]